MEMLSLNIHFLWFVFLEHNCSSECYIRTGCRSGPTSPSYCSVWSVQAWEELLPFTLNIKSCDFLPPPTIKATPLCWCRLPCNLLFSPSSSTTRANTAEAFTEIEEKTLVLLIKSRSENTLACLYSVDVSPPCSLKVLICSVIRQHLTLSCFGLRGERYVRMSRATEPPITQFGASHLQSCFTAKLKWGHLTQRCHRPLIHSIQPYFT